ncbi:putative amidoligase domain-containing protein [Cohnella caldifontis]|uniref:putative amidoligase domain-containing protein n=1 Tax=Cohnella caldifontis TaxID=3027471 RepID=UPI0023EDE6C5|nr:hypothetical protein [Cohnella sp. YIM B05605]
MKAGTESGNAAARLSSETARRLEREGLKTAEGGREGVRAFTVTVIDLHATDVRRLYGNRRLSGGAEPDDRLRKIAARAAARALYVLGRDFGQVVVVTDENGRPAVAGVSGAPRPSPGEGRRRTAAAAAMRETRLTMEKEGVRAVLGADPEFVLRAGDGKLVPASRYLPPGGAAGCDSVVRRGIRHWVLAELRPAPAEEPAELAASIRRLLAAAARRIGTGADPAWLAGAWPVPGLPLGGHIHFSGVALTGERLRALDNAVALPLRLLEPLGAAARRPRYGALGDFRRQPHGFEYRTPPSWLVSRRLAAGVLALAKIAAEHSGELAAGRPLDDDRLRDAFYGEGEEEMLRSAFGRYFETIQRTAGYRKYAREADYVFRAVADRRQWDEHADIRAKWGLLTE